MATTADPVVAPNLNGHGATADRTQHLTDQLIPLDVPATVDWITAGSRGERLARHMGARRHRRHLDHRHRPGTPPDAHRMNDERATQRTLTVAVDLDAPSPGVIEVRLVGDGPAVVLIPSAGRGRSDFDDLGARLADAGYTAVMPEPRGIGGSTASLGTRRLLRSRKRPDSMARRLASARRVPTGRSEEHGGPTPSSSDSMRDARLHAAAIDPIDTRTAPILDIAPPNGRGADPSNMAKKNQPVTNPPRARYEYRVWGRQRKARKLLEKLASDVTEERVKDCYLLVEDSSWNAKVRNNTLKVKQLVSEDKGFERWSADRPQSADDAPSPFDDLFERLQLDRPQRGKSYDLYDAVANLEADPDTEIMFVIKNRRRYTVGNLRAEVTDIEIVETSKVLHTLAIEGENLDDLVSLRKKLGLRDEPNLAVHEALAD